nr:hypothetical protein [Tanacetum cinerariifolium]
PIVPRLYWGEWGKWWGVGCSGGGVVKMGEKVLVRLAGKRDSNSVCLNRGGEKEKVYHGDWLVQLLKGIGQAKSIYLNTTDSLGGDDHLDLPMFFPNQKQLELCWSSVELNASIP